jgi:hypothetical protein
MEQPKRAAALRAVRKWEAEVSQTSAFAFTVKSQGSALDVTMHDSPLSQKGEEIRSISTDRTDLR